MLPLQLIFSRKTAIRMQRNGHHLTQTPNHLSKLETCKDSVVKILKPWWLLQGVEKNLPESVKMVWPIDCWSVHISKNFREWLKDVHSNWLCIVFVPANSTSKL